MTTINNLSTIDSVSGGDQVPVYDQSAGTARKMSVSQLLAFFSVNFASPEFEVQTAAPSTTGFTLTLTASTQSIWAILSPTGAFASGTIVLPPVADCFDGQQILVTSSTDIGISTHAKLTVDGNGATLQAAPETIPAGGSFVLRYRTLTTTWYFVGASYVDGITSNKNTGVLDVEGFDEVHIDAEAGVFIDASPLIVDGPAILGVYAFASLPSVDAGGKAFVNNCSTTTFNAAADGAGANFVPVFFDGSAWKVG